MGWLVTSQRKCYEMKQLPFGAEKNRDIDKPKDDGFESAESISFSTNLFFCRLDLVGLWLCYQQPKEDGDGHIQKHLG